MLSGCGNKFTLFFTVSLLAFNYRSEKCGLLAGKQKQTVFCALCCGLHLGKKILVIAVTPEVTKSYQIYWAFCHKLLVPLHDLSEQKQMYRRKEIERRKWLKQ